MSKLNIPEFLESLKEMSVLELNELVKAIEEEFGVTAAAAVVAGPAAGPAEVDEGPKTYNVELTNFGDNKIKVIKVVRELTGLGLKEAKDLVEAAPTMFKENVDEATANDLKGKLEEAGAVVTLK